MTNEHRLGLVGFVYWNLPKAGVSIECLEEIFRPQTVQAVVHPRQWVRVLDRCRVESAVVDAKTRASFGFLCKHH